MHKVLKILLFTTLLLYMWVVIVLKINLQAFLIQPHHHLAIWTSTILHAWPTSDFSWEVAVTKLQATACSYRITSKPLCSNIIILWPRLILLNNDLHYVNLLLLFKSWWYCLPQYPVFPNECLLWVVRKIAVGPKLIMLAMGTMCRSSLHFHRYYCDSRM